MDNRLNPLQRDLLDAFFRHVDSFVLTGGAALAGFHLGHRETLDLDFFTQADELDSGERALHDAAKTLGASVEAVQTSPTFRRRLVRRGDEAIVVDLVHDPTVRGETPIVQVGPIRVDPPEEILANKLTTLLSRAEIRDLVDVAALEREGYRVEDALALARKKDAGLTPGQLSWVLSQIKIRDGAKLPGGTDASVLRAFLADLCGRLNRLAFP